MSQAQKTATRQHRSPRLVGDGVVQAASAAGLVPFCITIDAVAHSCLPMLFGRQGHVLVPRLAGICARFMRRSSA